MFCARGRRSSRTSACRRPQGGPRVYRRADVEFVLRIKHLLFVEGLTLAGARRKLLDEAASRLRRRSEGLDELLGSDARERILLVKRGLKEIAVMLAKQPSKSNTAAAQSLFDLVDSKPSAAKRASAATRRRLWRWAKKKK